MGLQIQQEINMGLGYDNLNSNEELSQKEYRRDSYKLLSECYYLPDEGLIKYLGGLDTKTGGLFSDPAKLRLGMSDMDALIIDYSKLFVGPYGLLASPYGSAYLEEESRIMGDSTVDVKKRYEEEGLDISLKEAPDHIAIELEFMYFLVFKEIEAFNNHDSEGVALYQRKQRTFSETHLGVWISEFADKIESKAQTEFYKTLAQVTRTFVCNDMNTVLNSNDITIDDSCANNINGFLSDKE